MTDAKDERRERLYGRRVGKPLSTYQQELLEKELPRLSVPETGALDLAQLFPQAKSFAFEVGFGGGEHLAAQAQAHPDRGFIGCEPFVNGAARLLAHIDERKLSNIRVHMGDAREVMSRLPSRSLSAAYLLFPDPWPKLRHHKRRFVSPKNLDDLVRLIVPGGEFRVATDHMDYAAWTLQRLMVHPAFEWTADRAADWRTRPADWPPTRYEQKALSKGLPCVYLRFIRRNA